MTERYKPGQTVPASGQVEIRGPRGGDAGGTERTVVRGETFPPSPEPGQTFVYTDYTNNNSGKKK